MFPSSMEEKLLWWSKLQADVTNKIFGMRGIEGIIQESNNFKLVGRDFQEKSSLIKLNNGFEIGNTKITVIAGPCAVESKKQLFECV